MSLPCFPFRAPRPRRSSSDASGPDSRVDELHRAIQSLLRDMEASADGSDAFTRLLDDFIDYTRAWKKYRDESLWTTSDELDRWEAQYNAFRDRLAKLVGKTPEAPPIAPHKPGGGIWGDISGSISKGLGTLETGLIVVALLAGAYVVSKAAK